MAMASPGGLPSLGLLARAAAVLLLLAGVLAMHAVTAGHGGGNASLSSAAGANFSQPASVEAGPHLYGAAPGAHKLMKEQTAVTTSAQAGNACGGCQDHQAPAQTGSHLLEVCLAVLAAAGLLLLLIGRARRATQRLAHALTTVTVAIQPLVGVLRPPSLSNLCVLRT